MKNRHRVSQVVSKLIYSRAARRKILKQGAADCGEYRQACSHLGIPPIAKPYATAPAAWRYSPLSAAQRTPKVRLIAASFLGRQRSASLGSGSPPQPPPLRRNAGRPPLLSPCFFRLLPPPSWTALLSLPAETYCHLHLCALEQGHRPRAVYFSPPSLAFPSRSPPLPPPRRSPPIPPSPPPLAPPSALSVGAVFQLTVVKPIHPQARTACLDRSCMTCEGQ